MRQKTSALAQDVHREGLLELDATYLIGDIRPRTAIATM
jgi:hypothetical protein